MREAYIIVDPCHVDALPYISAMEVAFGMLPICVYQDPKARFYAEQADPRVRPHQVAASVVLEPDRLESLLGELRSRFDIRAVIPWDESYVELAAAMLPHLDVDWMDGDALSMFRDKHRMKETITARDPSIRVPRTRLVRTVEDIRAEPLPDRFVIKPNDGMGSLNLGFFSTETDDDTLTRHLALSRRKPWILEELIDGPEFRINGLVRRDGTVQPLFVSEYLPRRISENLTLAYPAETQLRTTDERWPLLVDYATAVLTATGLRGSPFHLEVKVDDRGPAIIDLGARLASDGGGWNMSILHPDRPDVYAVSSRDYVGDNHFAMDPPDYRFHDAGCCANICGISSESGMIVGVSGIEQVEAMPEFLRWTTKPEVGQMVSETIDLATYSYIASFRHEGDRDETLELQQRVYDTIRLDVDPSPRPWSRGRLEQLAQRSIRKSSWLAHQRRTGAGTPSGVPA